MIPLWGVYPDKTLVRKNKHTPTFVEALFTLAKTWQQLKCPLTDKWIHKMWYIYTTQSLKNEIMPSVAMQTDLKIFILNEVGQTKTNTV